ncbi:3,4-dihydroxy-2-butanone-4-phosphate synthase [Methanospirillum stamsii]|uniref:3,4-dihydroxy-2-butanone 4-phosphate synthase n=1 Tax=Methanospirillum stamsii TaxID=1277351 RepID=A0A2V2NCG3_9EURY|nr:3,4-dihydroxy-2-butanone-4-phosphate synthase [Methanospirillum stamsii]PWR76275.1 3,4-dihydroxy-2-butanone-4-phosphate synthase [Methanospirillum stamsii]
MNIDAYSALRQGEMVLLYDFDDRERETDLAIRSDMITAPDICRMRNEAGGLICTAIPFLAAQTLGLPFAREVLRNCAMVEKLGDIPYDPSNNSSFSLWVNHRDTFTGITDRDRTKTVTSIAEIVQAVLSGERPSFKEQFRTPGHMPILIAAEKLLSQRHGQTELSVAMAEMAGINPTITICEMLDDESGYALSKEDAMRYAHRHNLAFIEGSEVLDRWEKASFPVSESPVSASVAANRI